MDNLVYQTYPQVTFATNKFINVPIILQYDDTPIISIVKEHSLGFTTEIPVYHADGTYLAKVKGTRVYPTASGKKAGIVMRSLKDITICEMGSKILFEIQHQTGDSFRASAELYTQTGCFIKSSDKPVPVVVKPNGEELKIGGMVMSNCSFQNVRIGILLRSNGSIAIGCN